MDVDRSPITDVRIDRLLDDLRRSDVLIHISKCYNQQDQLQGLVIILLDGRAREFSPSLDQFILKQALASE